MDFPQRPVRSTGNFKQGQPRSTGYQDLLLLRPGEIANNCLLHSSRRLNGQRIHRERRETRHAAVGWAPRALRKVEVEGTERISGEVFSEVREQITRVSRAQEQFL